MAAIKCSEPWISFPHYCIASLAWSSCALILPDFSTACSVFFSQRFSGRFRSEHIAGCFRTIIFCVCWKAHDLHSIPSFWHFFQKCSPTFFSLRLTSWNHAHVHGAKGNKTIQNINETLLCLTLLLFESLILLSVNIAMMYCTKMVWFSHQKDCC